MTIDQSQVNVSELQRLNEAILLTMDAIRRVVPQIQVAAQTQNPTLGVGVPTIDPLTAQLIQAQLVRQLYGTGVGSPWMGQVHPMQQLYGMPYGQHFGQTPWGTFGQTPWGVGIGQPWHLAQAQSPFTHFAQPQQPYGQQFAQQPYGQVPFGFGQPSFGFAQQRPF
jgi:hypothetical protein